MEYTCESSTIPEPKFTIELTVMWGGETDFEEFINKLRGLLTTKEVYGVPALRQKEVTPTEFFDVILRTEEEAFVEFRLRKDDLYLIGYQKGEKWLEFNNKKMKHLIPGSEFLGFPSNYQDMGNKAGTSVENFTLSLSNILDSIHRLSKPEKTEQKETAKCLIGVCFLICESVRLIPVYNKMKKIFDAKEVKTTCIIDYVHNWGTCSKALFLAEANKNFEVTIKTNVFHITHISQIVPLIGIASNFEGRQSFLHVAVDNDDMFSRGVPLVEVFSVRIDNIDGENPGTIHLQPHNHSHRHIDLYGTITVKDGLNTQYIYNRTSDNPEYVRPNQNASLTGPNQSVCALGSFDIELRLMDKDRSPLGNKFIKDEISWDVDEIGNKYNELVSQKLDGERGAVTVNYAVLRNAVAAKVTINIEGGESTVGVYGRVSANYKNWDGPNTTSLLFNKSKDDYVSVTPPQNIPLLRSQVAVPLENSLIITASLFDYKKVSAHDTIPNDTVEFPAKISDTFSKTITGQDGLRVNVTVSWSYGIFELTKVT